MFYALFFFMSMFVGVPNMFIGNNHGTVVSSPSDIFGYER